LEFLNYYILNFFNFFKFSKTFFLILLFSTSYAIFAGTSLYKEYGITSIIKLFVYPIAFLIGENLLKDKSEKAIIKIILIFAFSLALHGLLNFLYNFDINGTRSYNDFWTHEYMSATLQAALFCLIPTVIFYCVFLQKNIFIKLFSLLFLASGFIFNLKLSGRTFLFFLLIGIVLSLFLFLIIYRKNNNKKIRIKVLILTTCGFLICFSSYYFNIFGLQDKIINSELYKRIDINNLSVIIDRERLKLKLEFLKHFTDYLWGGNNLRQKYGYAHDLWLDTFDTAGIVTFLFLSAYSLITTFNGIKIMFFKQVSKSFKVLITTLYILVTIQFFIEPIIEGLPYLFIMMCMINGMINNFLFFSKDKNKIVINRNKYYRINHETIVVV
jgi:hypothetical protein